MGTWTSEGFTANSVTYYKSQLEQVFKNAFGNDFSVDPALPQGILIQELAEMFYNADMDSIEVMNRINLNTATGIFLDFIGAMRGTTRLIGTPATITVTVTSNPATLPFTIPEGQTFALNGGTEIYIASATQTISSANQSIVLTNSTNGETGAAINDVLATNIGNITNIVITAVSQGKNSESDIDYRNRLRQRYNAAQGTVEFLLNKLAALPCVKTCGVNYNDTSSTVDGIAAYCTEYMVVSIDGYDETAFKQEVAQCICDYKEPSSGTDGSVTQQVTDIFGATKDIKFTIPTKKQMSIQVIVSTPENGVLNLSNVDSIKEQLVTYINSLPIGKDVSFSRCMAPLTADAGFDVTTFKIKASGDADWTTNANYTIAKREYASINIADIEIGVP